MLQSRLRAARAAAVWAAIWAALASAGHAAEPVSGFFNSSDGLKIHYLELGQGSPVILIHGFTSSARVNWFANGVAGALAKSRRVIAIDCRGHGESDKPHDPAKYGEIMARDVFELMDHLKIERAHVHGYSMGGYIINMLLGKDPGRFITAAYGGSGVHDLPGAGLRGRRREGQTADESGDPEDEKGVDPDEADVRREFESRPGRDPEALAAVRQNPPWKWAGMPELDLTKLTLPVLAINGQFDAPRLKSRRMKRELPNFESVILKGKGHLTAVAGRTIPPLYIESLAGFINKHDAPAAPPAP